MKAPFDFVIKPKGERYNNSKKIGEKNLILNTEIYNHQFVNREAIVISVPTAFETEIQPGDTIITHHNVFRRWHNVKGKEKNSRSYFNENTYLIKEDQIFLYKRNNEWKPLNNYCFLKPIKSTDKFDIEVKKPLVGVVKYSNKELIKSGINTGDLVGFRSKTEVEQMLDGEKLYRIMNKFITIKYEYQGDEEMYNPSWA